MHPVYVKSASLLLTTLAAFLSQQVTAQLPTKPTFVHTDCPDDSSGNYVRNSTYRRNLDLLLSNLTAQASAAPFYNSSVGPTNGPDTAYGQYYCRGDISTQLCGSCLTAAAAKAANDTQCFGVRAGKVWFEECTLQFDNKSNVGVWDNSVDPDYSPFSPNVSDPAAFEKAVDPLIETLINKAAYGSNLSQFATGEANISKYETVYCLVQCSPDTRGLLCESCLKAEWEYWHTNYSGHDPQGLILFYPNCQLRYSLQPFYEVSSDSTPTTNSTSASPMTPSSSGKAAKHYVTRIIVPIVVGSILLASGVSLGIWFCSSRSIIRNRNSFQIPFQTSTDFEIGSVECFSFAAIEEATMKFSPNNKLGEGGFGSVYKGIHPNGQPLAIKRLAKYSSSQGIKEFKTEVEVVAKLQHRNLVRLLGFCGEHEEYILVYEYLPNLSLDKFLYDDTMSIKLDWKTRNKIIEGVASGLRYLHIDSLLTIVHRDLKPNNILLDEEMNPKIADFGIAKQVMINETAGNTSRIIGTYGYMAPEYAIKGRFSTKSDIYSFGVIILEILSGKNSNRFYDPDNDVELLDHAWRIWNDKAIEELVDPTLQDNYSKTEAQRCLQIGLLCVQDDPANRPTIRVVVSMLENPFFELPSPSAPSRFHNYFTMTMSTISEGGETHSSQVRFDNCSNSYHANDIV